MWSPEFGTVLYWQPPDVHIVQTDPSLVIRYQIDLKIFKKEIHVKTNTRWTNLTEERSSHK